jgi:hypothetical protein
MSSSDPELKLKSVLALELGPILVSGCEIQFE